MGGSDVLDVDDGVDLVGGGRVEGGVGVVGRDTAHRFPVEGGGETAGVDDGAGVREGGQETFESAGVGDVGSAGAEGRGGEGVPVAEAGADDGARAPPLEVQ